MCFKILLRCFKNDIGALGLRQTIKCSRIVSLVLFPTLTSGHQTVHAIRNVGIEPAVSMTHGFIQQNGDATWKQDCDSEANNHRQPLNAAIVKNHSASDYHTGKNE